MNKEERLEVERSTVYRVTRLAGGLADSYVIAKMVIDVLVEKYHVTVKWDREKEPHYPVVIWCDCMGFRGQKFAHIEHKHIRVVLDYQERGEPTWAEYRITGGGQKAKVEFLRMKENEHAGT